MYGWFGNVFLNVLEMFWDHFAPRAGVFTGLIFIKIRFLFVELWQKMRFWTKKHYISWGIDLSQKVFIVPSTYLYPVRNSPKEGWRPWSGLVCETRTLHIIIIQKADSGLLHFICHDYSHNHHHHHHYLDIEYHNHI